MVGRAGLYHVTSPIHNPNPDPRALNSIFRIQTFRIQAERPAHAASSVGAGEVEVGGRAPGRARRRASHMTGKNKIL